MNFHRSTISLILFITLNSLSAQQFPIMPVHDSYDIHYAELHWMATPLSDTLRGNVTYHFRATSNLDTLVLMLHDTLSISSIKSYGVSLNYIRPGNHQLQIALGKLLPSGEYDSLQIAYSGKPGIYAGQKGFFRGDHHGSPVLWTLSEPYAALCWWPAKITLDDKIDSTIIKITHPSEYTAVSNGRLQQKTTTNGLCTSIYKHTYPITSYLVAFAIGQYSKYTDWYVSNGDSLAIINYVYREDSANLSQITPNLLPVMDLYSELFGDYPFKKEHYGHLQCGIGGGMEHQTMTFMGYFNHHIMSHELAHSWFGNMITCGSWEDIWLNEGFATYATGLTYERMFDGFYWDKWKRETMSAICSETDGSVWVDDTSSVARIFDARLSYHKASYLLHMLRWVCGDSAFFKSVMEFSNHSQLQYAYAQTNDFIDILENNTGLSLTEFMNDWFYGQGYPVYTIQWNRLNSTSVELRVFQSTTHPSVGFFEMPVPIQLKGFSKDSTVVLNHQMQGESFIIDPGFYVDSVLFDPKRWIVTKGSRVTGISSEIQRSTHVFPNPATELLYFDLSGKNEYQVQIISMTGQIIKNENTFNSFIQVSSLKPSLYLIRIQSEDRVIVQKFMKQ